MRFIFDDIMPKYQTGGAVVMPYMTYSEPASAPATAHAAAASDKKGLTDKDVMELLTKLDGLPSDIGVITEELQNLYDSGLGSGLGPGAGLNASTVASKYLQTVSRIQVANFNKKEYDNAYKNASDAGALDEWAITDRGRFVCATPDGGEFKFLTAQQLKEDSEAGDDSKGYMPLTNSELLYYRANDGSMAFQNKVLSVVQNGIGMEGVTQLIQNAMASLGDVETSDQMYGATRKGKLLQGLQDFQKAVQESKVKGSFNPTTDNLYKFKYLTKSQAENAQEAFSYIWNMLPTNAKTLLKGKSDLTDEGAQRLVQTLVASRLTSKVDFQQDIEAGTGSKGSGSDNDLELSQAVAMVKGVGGVTQTMTIDKGNGIQMSMVGRMYNLPKESDNRTPISGDMSLGDMLSKSGLRSIVSNMQLITFGDQRIPPEALQGITYNGTGVMRAILPTNPDGTVNFSVLDAYEEAEKSLEALGDKVTDRDRREAFERVGLSQLLGADGRIDPSRFGVFLVTEGYTTDALSGVEASDWVREIDKWHSKAEADIITRSLSKINSSGTKYLNRVGVDTKQWWAPADWGSGNYDHIFKAAVYIPITTNTLAAAMTDNQSLDYYGTAVQDMENKYQNEGKILNMKSTSASALGAAAGQ